VRHIGLDVHRDFCEVAIIEDGVIGSGPRVRTTPEDLLLFAQSLAPTDEVVLENTGNARAIAAILQPHVGRVAIANALAVRLIAHARVKTDRIDARVLVSFWRRGSCPRCSSAMRTPAFFGAESPAALRW